MPRKLAPILALVAVAAGSGALWYAANSAEFRVTPTDKEPKLRLLRKVRLADADYFRAQEWSKTSSDALPDTMHLQFAVPNSFPFETRKDGQPIIRARLRHPDGRLFPLDIVTLSPGDSGERRLDMSIPRMWPKGTRSMVLELGSPSGAVAESWTISGLAESKQPESMPGYPRAFEALIPLDRDLAPKVELFLRVITIPGKDEWSRPMLAFEAVLKGPRADEFTISSVTMWTAKKHDRLEVSPIGESVQRIGVMAPIGFAKANNVVNGSFTVKHATDPALTTSMGGDFSVAHLDQPLTRPMPPGTMTYIPGWDGKDVNAPVTFHFGGKG